MSTNNYYDPVTQEVRKEIFRLSLGDSLFCVVKKFFHGLFLDESLFDGRMPTTNRRYIILTRKGFALWHAATLCGLCGTPYPDSGKVISDRNWKKMSIRERQGFTRGRDVFVVDDTVITGHHVMSIYNELNAKVCKSRTIAAFASDFSFSHKASFEHYYEAQSLDIEERREQTSKIMVSFYNLAVPFTAESPVYHSMSVTKKMLAKLRALDGSDESKGWRCEETPLDFGAAGLVESTFLIHAPPLNPNPRNILFRGLRVCYRFLSENEDPTGQKFEVTLVPWVMFDLIDYKKTVTYLLSHAHDGGVIQHQLMEGEPNRKRVIVHRVISRLFSACVSKRFFAEVIDETAWNFDDFKIETYHYNDTLLKEVGDLISIGCAIEGGNECPYHDLLMFDEEYDHALEVLLGTDYESMYIPEFTLPMTELGKLLCANRERDFNEQTFLLNEPKARKKFPIVFFTGEHRGIEALDYIRRTIASFHSTILNVEEISYLANALVPGEGSVLALVVDYPYIWGLHQIIGKFKRGEQKYAADIIQKFSEYWNDKVAVHGFARIESKTVDICDKLSPFFWPSEKEIWQSFSDDTELDRAKGVAEDFWREQQQQ